MAINPMLPMAFLLSERENRRRDVADALLPALLPVPAASRVALTAIVADSSVRRQETHSDQVAAQAIQAATSPTVTADSLSQLDRLAPVLARRPELRAQLLEQAQVGDTVVKLVQTASKGGKLDLDSDDLQPLRARLSGDQWSKITAAVGPASLAVQSSSQASTAARKRAGKKAGAGKKQPVKKGP